MGHFDLEELALGAWQGRVQETAEPAAPGLSVERVCCEGPSSLAHALPLPRGLLSAHC